MRAELFKDPTPGLRFLVALMIICPILGGCDRSGGGMGEPRNLPVTSMAFEDSLFISGINPKFAFYNNEWECGIGAVVPWAERLWVITYGPHSPYGSSDKLYEITSDFDQIIREESIGGTPANRMFHQESNQLFIGPYVIDSNRNIRVIPYEQMPGRLTANARHLSDPENRIYFGTMEEGLYEVDVNTLKVKTLYIDNNLLEQDSMLSGFASLLPGAHGKGLYSGQGVVVYANNGEPKDLAINRKDIESGDLAEWNGDEWKVIRRDQFTEVTGPGGLAGNHHPDVDPIWALGWDSKSILLGVRNSVNWSFYRLPKASHSYDGLTGWNTEWPRIRNIGTDGHPYYLMTMHGMFWRFPGKFGPDNSMGIRPLSAYLKVIGDFAFWNDRVVFGCDDAAYNQFLNTRKAKGDLPGPGQSNSNLWFVSREHLGLFGPRTADGAAWLNEQVKAEEPSYPFLFSGWDQRTAWIKNYGNMEAEFRFEVDRRGNNTWSLSKIVRILPGESAWIAFETSENGEWIRVTSDIETTATVIFNFSQTETRDKRPAEIFSGVAEFSSNAVSGGLLWSLGDQKKTLGILAGTLGDSGFVAGDFYELNSDLKLIRKNEPETKEYIRNNFNVPVDAVSLDDASVLVVDDLERRWRLPRNGFKYDKSISNQVLRICREVVTERDLFNCAGTFYELPAENADGFAKIRPVSSHQLRVHDYASYRGMLVISGIDLNYANENKHIIRSEDGKAAVWVGAIDDLWALGRPVGIGGPWKNTQVKASIASDPYLIGFYSEKKLSLSHQSSDPVSFRLEVDPIGNGDWIQYKEFRIEPGQNFEFIFPAVFEARWIRFVTDRDCVATAWLVYN